MDHIPAISRELIEYLERICPDRAPRLDADERKIWFEAGKVDLVNHLRLIHEQQIETTIEGR